MKLEESLMSSHAEDDGSARLAQMGFQPGEAIHDWVIDEPDKLLDRIQESLFTSTYSRIVPIHLTNADKSTRIPVVVVKAEARYDAFGFVLGSTPVGDWEVPGWYLEGWVVKSGFDIFEDIVRVRIVWDDPLVNDSLMWQAIPKEPNADASFEVVDW
jgi:hypothetical protein